MPGYHKEKRHRTSCQYFYKLPGLSRKAYMDAYHQTRSNGLCSIQTFISHLNFSPAFFYGFIYSSRTIRKYLT